MSRPVTYTFVNPNTPQAVEETLRAILLEKLLAGNGYPVKLPAAG